MSAENLRIGGLIMTRDEILEAARQAVTQDRAGTYGSPEDNFALIGRLWSEYLRARLPRTRARCIPRDIHVVIVVV